MAAKKWTMPAGAYPRGHILMTRITDGRPVELACEILPGGAGFLIRDELGQHQSESFSDFPLTEAEFRAKVNDGLIIVDETTDVPESADAPAPPAKADEVKPGFLAQPGESA